MCNERGTFQSRSDSTTTTYDITHSRSSTHDESYLESEVWTESDVDANGQYPDTLVQRDNRQASDDTIAINLLIDDAVTKRGQDLQDMLDVFYAFPQYFQDFYLLFVVKTAMKLVYVQHKMMTPVQVDQLMALIRQRMERAYRATR